MQDQALYERIENFYLSTEKYEQPFAARLADHHNWQQDYCAKLVGEYRRYMYLTAISKRETTPSAAVDEVWHFHLEDPEVYGAFCRDAVGKYIEHRPANGDADGERMKFQYAQTLALYEAEFGEKPSRFYWRTERDIKTYACAKNLSIAGIALLSVGIFLLSFDLPLGAFSFYLGMTSGVAGFAMLLSSFPINRKKGAEGGCGGGCGAGCGGC